MPFESPFSVLDRDVGGTLSILSFNLSIIVKSLLTHILTFFSLKHGEVDYVMGEGWKCPRVA